MSQPQDQSVVAQSLEELVLKIKSATRAVREPSVLPEDIRALEWLALAPFWPSSVAERGFPVGRRMAHGPVAIALLDRLESEGWIESSEATPPWSGRFYRMSRVRRKALLENVRGRQGSAARDLLGEAFAAAHAAESATSVSSPKVFRQWCDLVMSHGSWEQVSVSSIAERLSVKVQRALWEARDLGLDGSPEAASLLEAAEPLVSAVGGPLRVAFARCQRQLELFHRNRLDEHGLDNYQERPELRRALEGLIEGEDWALHYVGIGGVGKTMFLRHLQAKEAKRLGLATARVDFDYLNPNYPLWSPGLLLQGFAEELRLEAPESAIDYFAKLTHQVNTVHARLEVAQRTSQSNVSLGFEAEGFDFCLTIFVDALKAINRGGKRPLLILDTCEELSRLRVDGSNPRTLIETFRILEAIHERAPFVRVVFSGRRPLAANGRGWSWSGEELPPRKYLLLCPILGFDRAEARTFLARYRHRSGERESSISAFLHEGIADLSASSTTDELAELRHEDANITGSRTRCNPYDLALYARWAAADPTITAETLRDAGRHHYVRERIVARLRDDLKQWLPHLTVLGRFDEELLTQLTGRTDDFAGLWAEVRQQEWTNPDRGALSGGGSEQAPLTFWTIDRQTRSRLEAYYTAEESANWTSARQQVCSALERTTIDREWSLLTPSYFDTAAELLCDDPVGAANWWQRVENKILDRGAWEWADRIASSLLAIDGPLSRSHYSVAPHPLTAPVHALRANIQMRNAADADSLDASWSEVLNTLHAYPDGPWRALLEFRAFAGMAGHLRYRSSPPSADHNTELRALLNRVPPLDDFRANIPRSADGFARQLAYTEMALLDNTVEILERTGRTRGRPWELLHQLRERATRFGAWLGAPSWVVNYEDRITRVDPMVTVGPRWLPEWTDELPELLRGPGFDWIPPKNLAARRILEFARLAEGRYNASVAKIRKLVSNLAPPGNLDEDRLLSQAVRLGIEPNNEVVRGRIQASLRLSDQHYECEAHRRVPPYFVTAVQALVVNGRVDEALDTINFARETPSSEVALEWLNDLASNINWVYRLADTVRPHSRIRSLPVRTVQSARVARFMRLVHRALKQCATGDSLLGKSRVAVQSAARDLGKANGFPEVRVTNDLRLVSPGWRPWFARYLVVKLFADPKRNRTELDAITEYFRRLYASDLPKDLAFLEERGHNEPSVYAKFLPNALSLVGSALAVLVMYGGVRVLSWGVKSATERDQPWYLDLLLFFTTLGLLSSLPAMLRRFIRFSTRVSGLKFDIVVVRDQSDVFKVWFEATSTRIPHRWAPTFWERTWSLPPLTPDLSYVELARRVHHAVGPVLGAPKSWLGYVVRNGRVAIDISVLSDSNTPALCWEAAIGSMPGSQSQFANLPFEFRRNAAKRWESWAHRPGPLTLISVSAQRDWTSWSKEITDRGLGTRCVRELPKEYDPRVGVLMVQAEARVTSSSLRLSLQPDDPGFRASDLARMFPSLRILVLVGFDRNELTERTITDRLVAAGARTAAADLAGTAAPIVISIPGLPSRSRLADEVLEIIALEIARQPRNIVPRLRRAVRRIQNRIYRSSGFRSEDASELAFDVCYYAADHVNFFVDLDIKTESVTRGVSA